jgi:hypothetical protein
LHLVPSPPDPALTRWLGSLVLSTALLLMLSFVPRGLNSLVFFWPEAVLLLALAGMAAWGVSLAGLACAALAIIGRVFWLVRGLGRLARAYLRPGVPAA